MNSNYIKNVVSTNMVTRLNNNDNRFSTVIIVS